MKVLQSSEGLEATHRITQCHIAELFNLPGTVNFSENALPYLVCFCSLRIYLTTKTCKQFGVYI